MDNYVWSILPWTHTPIHPYTHVFMYQYCHVHSTFLHLRLNIWHHHCSFLNAHNTFLASFFPTLKGCRVDYETFWQVAAGRFIPCQVTGEDTIHTLSVYTRWGLIQRTVVWVYRAGFSWSTVVYKALNGTHIYYYFLRKGRIWHMLKWKEISN